MARRDDGGGGSIEDRLERLSSYDGESGDVWRGAARRVRRGRAVRLGGGAVVVFAVAAVTAVVGVWEGTDGRVVVDPPSAAVSGEMGGRSGARSGVDSAFANELGRVVDGARSVAKSGQGQGQGGVDSSELDVVPAGRRVVYTERVRVEVEDVGSSFGAVRGLVHESLGEYVSESSFRGGSGRPTGELTLRVLSSRRGDVVLALSELGEVLSHSVESADVSGQVVDLEARLRNERRVEGELLELLRDREDADLEEVIEMRRVLSGVRESIERLSGRLAEVRSRASLATVRVTLVEAGVGADEQTAEEEAAGFDEMIGAAWDRGIDSLVRSLAFVVRVAVGGAVVWVLALVVLVAGWHVHRVRVARAGV